MLSSSGSQRGKQGCEKGSGSEKGLPEGSQKPETPPLRCASHGLQTFDRKCLLGTGRRGHQERGGSSH